MSRKDIINNLIFCVELEGDGGFTSFTFEEKEEMNKLLQEMLLPIDEDKLDELATEYTNNVGQGNWQELEAYKAGYRKAKEG